MLTLSIDLYVPNYSAEYICTRTTLSPLLVEIPSQD